ncbi:MAG: glycosyltransferase N-terminal domain-containing protein, partial [Kiritimatiellia bacterium]|nr:glycosyltransferase N-terminal domain-containing protein [Kiritimatiellia bacterium]
MIWIVYNLMFGIGFALLLPGFLLRMTRRGGYRARFGERLALYRADIRRGLKEDLRPIWIHAVSVGELFVGLRLIAEIRKRDPQARFLLSVTTSTGRAIAERSVAPDTRLIYFPVDFPLVVRRAVRRLNPRALILVEGELWPNWIRALQARKIPVFLVNARLSDRSFRGYRKLRVFTRRLLPMLNGIFAQDEATRSRYIELGADPALVYTLGSAKYDLEARDPDRERAFREVLRKIGWDDGRPVLVGGSTWPGEEEALLDLVRDLRPAHPNLALLLAPRHVERAGEIEALLRRRSVRWIRKSALGESAPEPEVLLLDTTGELRHVYACADVIFIGKSLTEHGGQNPIEAAQRGRAV